MAGVAVAPRAEAPWSPWRDTGFRVFAAGNVANNIGDAVYAVALPLLVFDLNGSLQLMSLLAALGPVALVLGPVFGLAADRWGPRVLVVPGLVVQMVAALVLNAAAFWFGAPFLVLFVAGALVQLGGGMYRSGWMSGIPSMWPQDPGRARGALSSCYVATTVIGPGLAAALVDGVGYELLLWFNLLTFVAPIVVWRMGIHPAPADPNRPRSSPARELAAGWAILRRSSRVFRVMVLSLPFDFVSSTGTVTLVIFHLRDRWDMSASGVSAVLLAANVGALVGSLAVSERSSWPLRRLLAVGLVGVVACLLVLPAPFLPAVVVAFVVFFVVDSALAVATEMLVYRTIPAEAIGRSNGFWRLVHGVPQLLAPLFISVLGDLVGSSATFVVLAAIGGVSVAWLAASWRALADDAPKEAVS
ncbi:MAG TPA: MFS transporter [Acidimicrobiales bacterium]